MKYSLVRNLYQYRCYIWRNAWNELRYRYAGTGMGIFWNVIHPLVTIALYTLIFSWIFPQRVRGGAYVLHLTSGLLAWRAFTDTIQRGSNAFIENARYLKRLAIPLEVFIAKTALASTFVFLIYYLLLIVVTLVLGNSIGRTMFLLPVFLVFLQSLAFGMALILADFRTLIPDIQEMIQAFLPLWLWTLPVIYPESIVPQALRPWLYVNPPYVFLRAIRAVIFASKRTGAY